jgi:sulfite reductase beta subunit-like hemoprotein
MAPPDIPAAKRAGLPIDLERLERDGDGWLSPEDRYALKTHGVCAQQQDGVFMVRARIAGGVLLTGQARGLARAAGAYGPDWLHLTTRQNVELHWVDAEKVPRLLTELDRLGVSTRSACGHTLRNVVCSEDAGLGLDEPFDCFADARRVSDAIVARSAELNVTLPSRVNLSFGGTRRCRHDALINDGGFVSVVHDGQPGYELWAGGSLGKAPALAVRLCSFVARAEVLAAAEALIEVFIEHGDFERPAKGRMKFVVERLGADGFRAAWEGAFADARRRPQPAAPELEVLAPADRVAILGTPPLGGWSEGVRPQCTPGLALVTVDIPLGDTSGSELALLADLADRHGDGALVLSRDQDVVLRNVPADRLPAIRAALAERGLHLKGEAPTPAVRACTGSAVCALGITTAPEAGKQLLERAGRSTRGLRINVSGCPNSCAQHQAADIGLAGAKVRIDGTTVDGYQVFLGADLDRAEVGQVVGRAAAADAPAAVDALLGAWEALRADGETLSATVRRVGHGAFGAHLEAVLAGRWATGPEPGPDEPPAGRVATVLTAVG